MNLEDFLNLPTGKVADIVRSKWSKVCVFPTDGTRRWHMLEHLSRVIYGGAEEAPFRIMQALL